MSLIKCKECGKEISDKASSCPECGYVYKKQKTNVGKIVLISFITLVVSVGLFYGGMCLFLEIIPQSQTNNAIKSFYGEYELISYDFENLPNDFYGKDIFDDYDIIKTIKIDNSNSIDTKGGLGSKGKFNFANSKSWEVNTSSKVFLIFDLEKIINSKSAVYTGWKERKVCFVKTEEGLSQITCPLDDNTTLTNLKIKYKKVK